MTVLLSADIFNEIQRLADFPDIVVVGGDPGQQRVGADGLRRAFGQVADDDGVMVGARSLDHQFPEHRSIHVGQFQQLDIGGVFEQGFDQGHQPRYQQGTDEAARHGETGLVEQLLIEGPAGQELDGQHHQDIGQGQPHAGLVQGIALTTVPHPVRRRQAADQNIHGHGQVTAEQQPDGHGKNDAEQQCNFGIQGDADQHGAGGKGNGVIITGGIDVREGPFKGIAHEDGQFDQHKQGKAGRGQKQQIPHPGTVFADVADGKAMAGEDQQQHGQSQSGRQPQNPEIASQIAKSVEFGKLFLGHPFALADDHLALFDLEEDRLDRLFRRLPAVFRLVDVEAQAGPQQLAGQLQQRLAVAGLQAIRGGQLLAQQIQSVMDADDGVQVDQGAFLLRRQIPDNDAALAAGLKKLQIADDLSLSSLLQQTAETRRHLRPMGEIAQGLLVFGGQPHPKQVFQGGAIRIGALPLAQLL